MSRFRIWIPALMSFLALAPAGAGELNLGVQFDSWTSNYVSPFNGWEILTPLSVSFKPVSDVSLYGQAEFGNGSYTDSVGSAETRNLTALSDTVVGGEFHFKSFSLPSLLNVALNLPTGDSTWEAKQVASNIPTEFIDSRYRGRGFGASALYGLSFPTGSGEFGAAAGYLYSGVFNPSYAQNVPQTDLKLGDSVFLALNHVQAYADNQVETFRLSSYFSLPTQGNGANLLQVGANFNASYGWSNPKAFSLEVGAQAWLPSKRLDSNQQFTTEPHNSFGPRFYVSPSYSFGDFALTGQVKAILPNDYAPGDPSYLYDGGGWLYELEPSYRIKLDGVSSLRIFAAFDYVAWENMGQAADGSRVKVIYNLWTLGTHYEVKL